MKGIEGEKGRERGWEVQSERVKKRERGRKEG